jgi:hypothetical protein
MKMEQTECSETSAYKIQTPGNYPEENIQHTEHGESLKSRITNYQSTLRIMPEERRSHHHTFRPCIDTEFCCDVLNTVQYGTVSRQHCSYCTVHLVGGGGGVSAPAGSVTRKSLLISIRFIVQYVTARCFNNNVGKQYVIFIPWYYRGQKLNVAYL